MHVQDRPLHDEKGKPLLGKAGWRTATHFQKASTTKPGKPSKLCCVEMCTDPKATDLEIERSLNRRDAGNEFVKKWDASLGGTKDSLDLTRVRSVGGSGGYSDTQIDASRFLALVEANMGKNDWMIVRRVCGENYGVAQTIAAISPAYVKFTWPRFREAIDALIHAMAAAGRAERERARRLRALGHDAE
jgi:hypothetical protein